MKLAIAVIAGLLAGCSFIGARVPDHPPAPQDCPEGVIIADGLGTTVFLGLPTIALVDGVVEGFGENGELALMIFGLPSAVIGTVYLVSTFYGLSRRERCQRLQAADAKEEANRTDVHGAQQRKRAPAVGDKPMYCAISQPDVGQCFADETACSKEAANGSAACEARDVAWCFDLASIVGTTTETLCAVSQVDCDARRIPYARDATLVVTTCGSYTVRGATPASPTQ